jgi:hypothetical protein
MTRGWDGTYQVWIKNARLELINSCYTNHKWDPADPWTYVGESSGTKTFMFPFAATDILITWRNPGFLFDAAIADVDGKKAGYDYTIEGEPSRSWMDTSNVDPLPPEVVTQPCGMVGPTPDKSYTPTGSGVGGMMFRFIGRPYRELQGKNFEEEGGTAYHLTGLTVVAKPVSARDPSDTICPPLK